MHQGSFHKYVLLLGVVLMGLSGCRPLMVGNSTSERLDTSTPPSVDSSVLAMIDPYREQLSISMEVEVAELAEDLIKEQPEGSLGNHVAAVTYSAAAAEYPGTIDFAIMNYGGLRVPVVGAGPLKIKDAYQIMPFDNVIVVMQIDGETVLELAEKMAGNGGWPVYNMSYGIDDGHAVEVKINEIQVSPGSTYTMAISDYLADGGDNLDLLKQFEYLNTGILVRDAIINHWKNETAAGRVITEKKDGRVYEK